MHAVQIFDDLVTECVRGDTFDLFNKILMCARPCGYIVYVWQVTETFWEIVWVKTIKHFEHMVWMIMFDPITNREKAQRFALIFNNVFHMTTVQNEKEEYHTVAQ